MLRHLHVRNLAVLAEASVEFGAGLNVVTGETGAGKSLVVDSLALLAGGRASSELIRTGAELLSVGGVFQPPGEAWRAPLEEAGVECEGGELLVRREVSRSGRNRVFLNDQPVTLRLLARVAPFLLRIHGQRDELGLMSPELQRSWLDRQGGEAGRELLEACARAFDDYAGERQRLDRISGDERLRHERIDLLRFQSSEIAAAHLEAGEDDELRHERDLLRNSEAIGAALGEAVEALSGDESSAGQLLRRALAALGTMSGWEPEAASWASELREMEIRIEDLGSTLLRRLDGVQADPRRLDAIENRLAEIERLCRKYGASAVEILEHAERIETELEELESSESQREELEACVAERLGAYAERARQLSSERRGWAQTLSSAVLEELRDLALDKARFEVELEHRSRPDSPLREAGEPVEIGRGGFDQVTFLFSSNPGEELRSLARVASGGELARVYLALQVAARGDGRADPSTLIFDEVDSGIGGFEAAVLGRKLGALARGGQILAVTHLPQVAAWGDHHFRVKKQVEGERTTVRVDEVSRARRIEEVARMLAGEEITELSLSHARELLEGAQPTREDPENAEKTEKTETAAEVLEG